VATVRRLGLEVEVVSDGYGFYVEPALAAMGVTGVPILTAETSWVSGRPEITFPAGHPACFVCGTCKRERVLGHQARGRHVVLIGDGPSDRYAAAHADVIFAKSPLSDWCVEAGWPFTPWTTFDEVTDWLERVAADPSMLGARERPDLICGPEVWGPGRTRPPSAREATEERARGTGDPPGDGPPES
jgi:2-hydroxy-3-keto-5-methylthiopentenyl-1-phosphate phosphatase